MNEDARKFASRGVSAELLIGKVWVPINQVTLVHAVDQIPYAQVSIQLDNKNDEGQIGSVDLQPKKFAKMFQLFQDKIMTAFRLEPDCLLTLKDGNGTTVKFPSFLGRPKMALVEGQLELNVGLVHAKTAMQAFNAQIYNLQEFWMLPNLYSAFGTGRRPPTIAQGARSTNSISLRVLAILEWLLATANFTPNLLYPFQYSAFPIHNLNKKAFPIVREVLLDSVQTTQIPGLKAEHFNETNLINNIWMMCMNGGPFTNVLPMLCETFMFQMNADYQGKLWLEPIQFMEDPGKRIIEVPMTNLGFTCNHLFNLPVLQVVVIAPGSDLFMVAGSQGTTLGVAPPIPVKLSAGVFLANETLAGAGDMWVRNNALAKYPPKVAENAVGDFYIIQAPNWLSTSVLTDSFVASTYASITGLAGVKSRDELKPMEMANIVEEFKKYELPKYTVLEYMARMFYQELQLGGSSASIMIPLDFRPLPGRTYWVTGMDEEPLFIGYLTEVRHVLDVKSEGAAANTTLTFSHIRMVNSKLPEAKIMSTGISTDVTNHTDLTWTKKSF